MAITETSTSKPAKKPAAKTAKPAKAPKASKSERSSAPDLTAAVWKSIAASDKSAEDLAVHHKLPDAKMVTRCRTWARRFGLID